MVNIKVDRTQIFGRYLFDIKFKFSHKNWPPDIILKVSCPSFVECNTSALDDLCTAESAGHRVWEVVVGELGWRGHRQRLPWTSCSNNCLLPRSDKTSHRLLCKVMQRRIVQPNFMKGSSRDFSRLRPTRTWCMYHTVGVFRHSSSFSDKFF